MTLSNDKKKHLRQIGHALKPVLTVGDNGLSDNVLSELDRALEDHELIKVKLRSDDKAALIKQLIAKSGAELVQSIGHVALVYRPAKKPDPKLSNLLRHRSP
ncbi:MAG: ribosome assembly RNA-binding protein YhbY [Pseudomonadales bacterium]|nr:ribosome assembly RNA-binding protein YhbY [Gammaproteobacteria bacterium]NNL56343.1 ribosome assembly RNA-binding protein YhbY [Pseudomonadales bacterium]